MAKAAVIVMSSIVISRITGFIRETMLSWKVGLSWVQDAYVAAFTVPDLMYFLLVGGTISAALVPFLSGKLEQNEEKEGWKSASIFINVITIGMILLCALGVLFAPKIIPLIAPGFTNKSENTKVLAVRLSRILFPSVAFIMLAGICNGVMNTYRKFAAAAYGPSIYNAGCALSIYLFADTDPDSMVRVAVGVAVSAFLYFIIQLAFSIDLFKNYRFIIKLKNEGFRILVKQAVPSLLSSSITQINVIISTAYVSMSAIEGGLAAFRNANTAWQLPYGIFAMGMGTAILPSLSSRYAKGDYENYKNLMMKSLTSVLFIAIPSAAGFIVLREPIIRAIFKWGGKFTDENVPFVASILALFSVSMITQSIVAIMNRSFYAKQDTKTPLMIGICSVLMNIVLGAFFIRFTDLGPGGIALTFSIISTVNSIALLMIMNRRMNGIHMDKLFGFLKKAIASTLVIGVIVYVLESLPVALETKMVQLSYLLAEVLTGAAVYFGLMLILKNEDAIYFMDIIKQKLKIGSAG
jgi:putative peptidoglycan lipid II flippase